MAIKLTPNRRSQLVEQLLKQNQEQFAQNPQSWGETIAKMLAMGIRQGQAGKLQEIEAGAEKTQNANTANLANQIMGGGALDFQGRPIMQDTVDFQGRPIQGQQQQQPGNMRDAVTQTLKGDPQNPLALAALQNAMKTQDPTKMKIERVPLELKEDIKGVGKAGETVMGFWRANPITGENEYGVGSRVMDPTKVRPTENRTATRDADLPQGKVGQFADDIARYNVAQNKINNIKKMDYDKYLTWDGRMKLELAKAQEKAQGLPLIGGMIPGMTEEDIGFIEDGQHFQGQANQLFQAIRTEVTGAQAAMVELRYLQEAYLSGSMSPTQFKAAIDLLDEMNQLNMRIKKEMLDEGLLAIGANGEVLYDQTEFGRRFDERWEGGRANKIVGKEEAKSEGGPPPGFSGTPEQWEVIKNNPELRKAWDE